MSGRIIPTPKTTLLNHQNYTLKSPRMIRSYSLQKQHFKAISLIDFLTEYNNNFRCAKINKKQHSSEVLVGNNSNKIINFNIHNNQSNSNLDQTNHTSLHRNESWIDMMDNSAKLKELCSYKEIDKTPLEEKDKLTSEINQLTKTKKQMIITRMATVDNKRRVDSILNDIRKYKSIANKCKDTMIELSFQIKMLKQQFQMINEVNKCS